MRNRHVTATQVNCRMMNASRALAYSHAAREAFRRNSSCAKAPLHNQVHLSYTFHDVLGFVHSGTERSRATAHRLDAVLRDLKGDDAPTSHRCLDYTRMRDERYDLHTPCTQSGGVTGLHEAAPSARGMRGSHEVDGTSGSGGVEQQEI